MAQLKIDIVVDDNGAASKLNQVENAVKGVESASAVAATSVTKAATATENFAKTIGTGWSNVGTQVKAVASAFQSLSGAFVGISLGAAIHDVISFTSRLQDLSAKTGTSVRDLQKLDLAGGLVGVSIEQVSSAISQMQNRLVAGTPQAADAMKRLGLSIEGILDMDPGTAMNALADAFGKIKDPAERTRIAMELFGRSGAALLPMLTGELKNVGDAMERFGLLMSDAAVEGGDALDDFATLATTAIRKVVSEWMHLDKLGKDMRALGSAMNFLNGPATPGAPNAPSMFSGGSGISMPSTEELLGIKVPFEAAAKARVNPFSGSGLLSDAGQALRDVAAIGGLTKLTADETNKLNDLLGDALLKYAALGRVAPTAMVNTWIATMKGVQVTDGLLPGIGQQLGLPTVPEIPIPALPFTSGLSGGLPGESLGLPTAPAISAVSPFRSAFAQLGRELPDIIFGTLQHGGNVVGAIASGAGALFAKNFQDALQKAGGDTSQMSLGSKALGLAGAGIGAGITGFSLGQKLGKGKGALSGAAAGALAGSVVPGIGTAIGAGVGALAGFFGGRSADKKAAQEMIQQREEWIKSMGGMEKLKQTAADLGVNIDKAFSTKKPEEFRKTVESLNAAMEKQKNLTEGINAITAGTNARAANVTGQGDLNVVGAGAVASFGLQLGTGTSAVDALNALNPAIVAMRDALAGGNFQMSEAGNKLLGLAAIVEAERVPFQNLAADGQILQGMMQGNIRDFDLFRAIATDIGTSLQGMIDRGVPTAQILTLAQPQLQALWEAQQKWHVEVDATTQGLLNQAVQQGTVGENMKSIQQQMLDATLGIRDAMVAIAVAMGALPSAAQNAANGMNAAFGTVQAPGNLTGAPLDTGTSGTTPFDNGGGSSWTDQSGLIYWGPGQGSGINGTPNFATGGVVRARPGGTLVRVGEAGQDEAITPMNRRSRVGSGGGVTVVVNVEGSLVHQDDLDVVVAQAWSRAVRSNKSGSYTMAQAALGNA